MGAALEHSLNLHYSSVSLMFGVGLLMLWLMLVGYSIRELSARAILSLTGHLRARPDPWLESALRKAFAEFDRELAVILHDKSGPARPAGSARQARPARPVRPGDLETSSGPAE